MKISVTTTPARLPVDLQGSPVIQNLGPGTLYLDSDDSVSATTGVALPAGASYEFVRDLGQGSGSLWMVSDDQSDVRYLVVG